MSRCIRLVASLFLAAWSVASAFGAESVSGFTDIVEANGPAVVNISTTQKVRPSGLPDGIELEDIPPNSPFYEFFRRFFNGDGGEREVRSLGSGFIISPDGYIVTNRHVIKDADSIVVRLSDRRELSASVVGTDEPADIALLKIDAGELPVVIVSKDRELEVGEWVVAIGSPFGFERSVSAGIVSARGRSLPRATYVPFIQTDVAINPGNSGGPLLNLDGEVVGINSAIYSGSGGYIGLSFAIPIEVAMNVVEQIKATGRVARGRLGVSIQDVNRDLADSFGMTRPAGALITQVVTDGPGETAKLEPGDIVLAFDGKRVQRAAELPPLVGLEMPGSRVPVEILRNGETMIVEVTLGEVPAEPARAAGPVASRPTTVSALGITIAELTREQRSQSGLKDLGVRVVSVEEGPAKRAGIRPEDVILMLANKEIRSPKEFAQRAASLPAERSVALLVQRDGRPLFLALKTDGGDS